MQKECVQRFSAWFCVICTTFCTMHMHSTYLMAFCQNASSEYLWQGYSNKFAITAAAPRFSSSSWKKNTSNKYECPEWPQLRKIFIINIKQCMKTADASLEFTFRWIERVYVERRRAKQVFVCMGQQTFIESNILLSLSASYLFFTHSSLFRSSIRFSVIYFCIGLMPTVSTICTPLSISLCALIWY